MLVDSAERPEDIDALKAKQAADAAKEAMLQKQSIREYRTAQMTLARAVARLRVKKQQRAVKRILWLGTPKKQTLSEQKQCSGGVFMFIFHHTVRFRVSGNSASVCR